MIVGLVVIAWLLLAGLPFGGDDGGRIGENEATETIAEGTSTRNEPLATATVIEVPGGAEPALTQTATTDTIQPPLQSETNVTTAPPPPAAATQTPPPAAPAQQTPPPQRTTTPPPQRTTPAPVQTPPPPPPETRPSSTARSGEISDAEAAATLRSYITSNSYYEGVTGDCVQVRSQGYQNVGYTYSVWDACVSGGGSRMLGRWRVDSKTREVFRQREDGRFLRP